MVITLKDEQGKVIAYTEYQIVNRYGKQCEQGTYAWVNDCWIHPSIERKGTLKILFELHNGNLRDTLKSLSACVMELSKSNNPVVIDEILMQKLLQELI